MSADNCVAILQTKDRFRNVYNDQGDIIEAEATDGITAYRVAYTYMSALENYDWCIEHEMHNLGAHMLDDFKKSHVYYDRSEAIDAAQAIADKYDYLEYGICFKDMSNYNFPFC